jgi:hypothetical protein
MPWTHHDTRQLARKAEAEHRARKLKESEMDIPRGEIWVPIQAKSQGSIDTHNGRLLTGFYMTESQLRDTAATALECMTPAARALLLEQMKETA